MKSTLRIAVAEDERDTRDFLQEALTRLGHEVVAVSSGRQLVDLCRHAQPDLVVTDIKMPDGDGLEAAAAINRERPVPVVVVSAHHDPELLQQLAADYFMGYLIKPVTEADLKTAVTVATLRFRHFQALARESADLRQALEDRKAIERAKGAVMKRLRVDEEEAFRRLRMLASNQNLKLVEVSALVLEAEAVFHKLEQG